VTTVAVGLTNACAIIGGGAYCWGSNSAGQLGNGTPEDSLTPTIVAGFPVPTAGH
jgi:alpha-tubulin suppressor-like RCC1 family protein